MIESINADELQSRLSREPLTLVDVREVHEYRAGHVPGAVNIPLSLLPLRVSELPASKPLYVICQSGGRSMQASSWLARN
ncbi:MAG: rhodanese-like domain-containing protein, partial [Propionicimonas sp.]